MRVETRQFSQLSGGERFIRNNRECVKLDFIYIAQDSDAALVSVNAVELDRGALVLVQGTEEVMYLTRSY